MDYNPNPVQMPPHPRTGANSFLAASATCALFAFLTECFLPLSMIFASLAILFAVLSKGKQLKMHSFAKMSVGIAIFSMVFSVSILAFSIWTVFTVPGERERFNQTYKQMYGITFDEALEEFQQSIQ
ncbi:MAG: hypothetical protein HDR00_09930 [Lachnospiraceae bacterium]|nr:hypothetical protein [Lachnospiraceae bacterium]